MPISASKGRVVTLGSVALAFFLALTLAISFGAGTASAGEYYKIDQMKAGKTKTVKCLYVSGKKNKAANKITFWTPSSKKLTLVKYNKKKVAAKLAKRKNKNGTDEMTLVVRVKKAGASKVTFKLGSKTYKVKIVAKKFTFPIKSFTVGKDNYAPSLKKAWFKEYASYTTLKATSSMDGKAVKVVANKEWKLVSINEGGMKNGETFEGDYGSIVTTLKHKKTGTILKFDVFRY